MRKCVFMMYELVDEKRFSHNVDHLKLPSGGRIRFASDAVHDPELAACLEELCSLLRLFLVIDVIAETLICLDQSLLLACCVNLSRTKLHCIRHFCNFVSCNILKGHSAALRVSEETLTRPYNITLAI